MEILGVTLIIFVVILIYFEKEKADRKSREIWEETQRRKRDAEKQKIEYLESLTNSILSRFGEYLSANYKYSNLYNGFVANYPFNEYRHQFQYLLNYLTIPEYQELFFDSYQREVFDIFMNYINRDENYRKIHNKSFIDNELVNNSHFFNTSVGLPFDKQQSKAILTDEDNNLVIAGAGSGKTKTIIGKVKYLVEKCSVEPSKILLVSFTKKSVEDLGKKIEVKGIKARTFNSFGLEVINTSISKQNIFDESSFSILIEKIYRDLTKDKIFTEKLTNFLLYGYKIEKDIFTFESHGEYIQYLKEENFQPYELNTRDKLKTNNFEKVKSIEECKIANFLFINNIEYVYELPYPNYEPNKNYKFYKPDFTIYSNNKVIYLEHFGINKNGQPSPTFIDPQKYIEGIKWKREFHQRNNTLLIESYSYENTEGKLLINLKEKLEKLGVVFKPKSFSEILSIINQKDPKGQKKFLELIQTFIVLFKSNNYEVDFIKVKISKLEDSHQRKRSQDFFDIIKPIYEKYQQHLISMQEIDFSDMINIASDCITEGLYTHKFDYIIVDEFQDLSIGRYNLIKSLKHVNPFCKLFAVGDDWQSIYRFTGSDIALFKDFSDYFGYTEYSKIETTYRFSQPLIEKSSQFVLKNPNQTVKKLKSFKALTRTDYKAVFYSSFNDNIEKKECIDIFDALAFTIENEILAEIRDICEVENKILLLGRYNFDLKRFQTIRKELPQMYLYPSVNFKVTDNNLKYKSSKGELSLDFLSIHKAKGLEREIVIIINNEAGDNGFPSNRSDDPILNLLLSSADQFENGEERRLFYVALTRAKEKLFLLAQKELRSKFISELVEDDNFNNKCKRCKTGDKVLRKGINKATQKSWAFYSCSNFNYGCEYQEWL